MRDTFPGVSATMQVMAVSPYTPSAVNVFRSACAPAPPLLSEPAIVRATGVAAVCDRRGFLLGIGSSGHRPPLQNRLYAPSLPMASTGQPSIASLQSASRSEEHTSELQSR